MKKVYSLTRDLKPEIAENIIQKVGYLEYIDCNSQEEIIEKCKDADALICMYEPLTEKVINSLKNLKFISVLSIGYNTVDIEAATKNNILVSNNPNYCTEEVADHTAALVLNMNRQIVKYNKSVHHDKKWDFLAAGNIYSMSTQTFGLLGFGSIAKKVYERIKPFGCKFLVYDPFVNDDIEKEYDIELVDLNTLLKDSDIISLHIPLNKHTKNLISYDEFKIMKKNAVFVNCARGEVVNQDALIKALRENLISGAALDVLSSEKPDLENCKLVGMENVILTPHTAFYSIDSDNRATYLAAKHVVLFFQNKLEEIPILNK